MSNFAAVAQYLTSLQARSSFSTDEEVVVRLVSSGDELDLRLVNGSFVGLDTPVSDPQVVVPLSPTQRDQLAVGEFEFGVAYMRGDVKPTGSTRAILLVAEALG